MPWLTDEASFDPAIDYKSEDVQGRLKELCPKGIDIFFDNVGGDILDAALARLAMRGRIMLCGGVANYKCDRAAAGTGELPQLARPARTDGGLHRARLHAARCGGDRRARRLGA
jgi:NADPH-dependent curcumin reductase CurA